jgi:hypothetical protein
VAFIEATCLIRGHDVIEEFLACGLLVNGLVSGWR